MKPAALVLVAALSWCAPTTAPAPPPAEPPGEGSTPALAAEDRGEALSATIPLYGDGVATLADVRGTVVVLEFFSPGEPDWAAQHDAWRELRAAHEGRVEVIAVATASEDVALVDRWDADPPRHIVGWDPQGALALRLGIEALPTVIVLDAQGRLVASGQDRAALRATAESLVNEPAA
ncbi:MAG: TlpA disulfide reductase family protein [Myxococcota bacterium]